MVGCHSWSSPERRSSICIMVESSIGAKARASAVAQQRWPTSCCRKLECNSLTNGISGGVKVHCLWLKWILIKALQNKKLLQSEELDEQQWLFRPRQRQISWWISPAGTWAKILPFALVYWKHPNSSVQQCQTGRAENKTPSKVAAIHGSVHRTL